MTPFSRFAVVDWSGGNDTGPRPRKDAIWLCSASNGHSEDPVYIRNRRLAEDALCQLVETTLRDSETLMIGFDFPFGFPKGFARHLTGLDDPFAVWAWLTERMKDTPQSNNRFDVAAEINRRFPGVGPFWFNGLQRDIPDLPRKDVRTGHGMPERRAADHKAKGAFACWQMGGAGAVGGQVLTGLPVLQRLRARFGRRLAIWPFERIKAPIVCVEIWPGLINPAVKCAEYAGGIRDAMQVRLLVRALSRLPKKRLHAMLDIDAPEEGWILGLGHEEELMTATRTLKPPPLKDDCFALPAGVDWTPVDEALQRLRERLHPVVTRENVPLSDAAGRICASDLCARRANPPAANSAVDGYAVAHRNTVDGTQTMPLTPGRAAAGAPFEDTVPEGHALRILTGASVPKGVDTVVLQEDVTSDDTQIAFRGPLKPNANTRKAGEDVATGDLVVPQGRRITPADLALCAATGHAQIPVFRQLKVGVLSTGDELIEPGEPTGDSGIFDANRPMLAALLKTFGCCVRDIGRVPDDRQALQAAFDTAARECDVLVTSGGASSGDEDHVSALLNETGTMQNWRIAIKPGRPLALGLWRGTPVFGLPGNPVAALVCTLIFARPALRVLSGEGWSVPEGVSVPAAFAKRKKAGRREYLRARLRNGHAEVFASEGSGRISGLSWAEGLVELPDGALDIKPGDPVRYLSFTAF